jgi:antitoxin PrlF
MESKATMTSKGQVTIPLAIRQALGLDAGTQLSFELSEGEFRVRPINKKAWADLWKIASKAPHPSKPVDIGAAIASAVRERSDR